MITVMFAMNRATEAEREEQAEEDVVAILFDFIFPLL